MVRNPSFILAAMLAAGPALAQDFNGDQFDDLAIGSPGEDFGPNADAGAVTVIYGSPVGLNAFFPLPSMQYSQSASGIEVDETGDRFGAALAWGDFNGDGFDDLAIGVPGEDTSFVDAGAVAVLYGSPAGLILLGVPYSYQPSLFFGPDPDEAGDRFGAALAVGDFNLDGFADLAMGAPGEDVGATVDAGLVHINHGDPFGIFPGLPAPVPVFDQSASGLDPVEMGDAFAGTLATGDFDGDMVSDLAIACEFEDIGAAVDAGGVTIVPGSFGVGLVPGSGTATWWHQDTPGIQDVAQNGDRFGAALATGDFDLNRGDDLAVGAPGETIGLHTNVGVVHVIYSDVPSGLNAFFPVFNQLYQQNSPGVPSVNLAGDNFGAALAVFWNDGPFGFEHLAIGIPGDNVGNLVDTGSVVTIYSGGLGVGLSATAGFTAPELWHQNAPGIQEANGNGDRIGTSLASGDYDHNLCQDLAIGVPMENRSTNDDGCVNVIYGVPAFTINLDAFIPILNQLWDQGQPGIPDTNQAGDQFGGALDAR